MTTRRSFLSTLLALPLSASFIGASCTPGAIIPVIEAGLQDAQMVLNMIEAAVSGYFTAHPNATLQAKIAAVETDTLSALRLVDSALAAASDINSANVQAALQAFSDTFNQLVALVGQIGIQVAPIPATKDHPASRMMRLPDGTVIIAPPAILMHLKVKVSLTGTLLQHFAG